MTADVIQFPPRPKAASAVTDCDAVTLSELDALADRFAQNAEAFAALTARVEQRRESVTGILGNAPPALPDSSGSDSESELEKLERLVDAQLDRLERCRDQGPLWRVTLAGFDVAPLLATLGGSALGVFLVTERAIASDAEHVHGLALGDGVPALARDLAARAGLHPSAVLCERVKGWRGDRVSLRRSLFFIAQYDLAIGAKASKRSRELPIAVTARGIFAGCDGLARFALADVTAPTVSPASVTGSRLCRWCRVGQLAPRQRDDAGCSATCRQRASRTRRRVTRAGDTEQRVTSKTLGSEEPAAPRVAPRKSIAVSRSGDAAAGSSETRLPDSSAEGIAEGSHEPDSGAARHPAAFTRSLPSDGFATPTQLREAIQRAAQLEGEGADAHTLEASARLDLEARGLRVNPDALARHALVYAGKD